MTKIAAMTSSSQTLPKIAIRRAWASYSGLGRPPVWRSRSASASSFFSPGVNTPPASPNRTMRIANAALIHGLPRS
jgi:hypothetical protein